MTDTDSGWRKRQIALDVMAENARELGLDYEPVHPDPREQSKLFPFNGQFAPHQCAICNIRFEIGQQFYNYGQDDEFNRIEMEQRVRAKQKEMFGIPFVTAEELEQLLREENEVQTPSDT